jgi:hypothetical protein
MSSRSLITQSGSSRWELYSARRSFRTLAWTLDSFWFGPALEYAMRESRQLKKFEHNAFQYRGGGLWELTQDTVETWLTEKTNSKWKWEEFIAFQQLATLSEEKLTLSRVSKFGKLCWSFRLMLSECRRRNLSIDQKDPQWDLCPVGS